MSARRSRVRPVPDFSRAHQLFESQMEARKKDMKKCTKVEEFNLSRGFIRGDGSSATPVHCSDISKPSPRHPDFLQLQANSIQGSEESSSDVNFQKDCRTTICEPGFCKKASGILKNGGRMNEAISGQRQVRRSGAAFARRPRVTFDIASPLRESPSSVQRRVLTRGRSLTPGTSSPKSAASRMLVTCNRVPIEPSNRTAQSARHEKSQPQRVIMLGSGHRLTISQSCSRAACMGGFSRFRADSIAKAIDFNEETEEEDGKLVSQDVLKNARPSVESEIGVKATNKRFAGLKRSPIRKIHVDVTGNEDSSSVSSPLLRLNTNSDAVVRSPLSRKMERIERIDAKIRSRLPQPRGKVDGKENRPETKKRRTQDAVVDSQLDKTDLTDDIIKNSQDEPMPTEGVKKDALEQSEMVDAFDPNQTISKLEKKAQRLRRRSQLTEEKSEHDYLMKKLDALQKKIESMRMEFQSVKQTDPTVTSEGVGSYERSASVCDVSEPLRNETKVCPTEMLSLHDERSDAVESNMDSESREEVCETPVVTCEVKPEQKVDGEWSDTLLNVAFEITPESKEDIKVPDASVGVVSDITPEFEEVEVFEVSEVMMVTESESMVVPEIESRLEDVLPCDVMHGTDKTELEIEEGVISDVPSISQETESQSRAEFEIEVPEISLETESRSENQLKCDSPCSPLPADSSEFKENVDPLSLEDVSMSNNAQNDIDSSLGGAGPAERVVLQDITEIQTRAVQFDEDDGIFVVEESSDDSDLMNSEDFTEWSSSPIVLMNQCLTNIECELSSELSIALSPEDVLADCLAKVSISDRLESSNVEASPNMSSEFMQYSRYAWREGVDGGVRLFNPVAAALEENETDDAHFVPISPP